MGWSSGYPGVYVRVFIAHLQDRRQKTYRKNSWLVSVSLPHFIFHDAFDKQMKALVDNYKREDDCTCYNFEFAIINFMSFVQELAREGNI